MKTFYTILFFISSTISVFGQISLFKNSTYRIDSKEVRAFSLEDTNTFRKTAEYIYLPTFSTLRVKFRVMPNQLPIQQFIFFVIIKDM